MLRTVMLKTLRDHWRALLWWAVGLVGLAVYLVLLYPGIRDTPGYNELLNAMPEALLKTMVGEYPDFASPTGYLNSSLFFMAAPLLFIIFTLTFDSGMIAGEEERGTLELLLAYPLPRWRVVLEKFAALFLTTVALAAVFWLSLVMGMPLVEMEVSPGHLGAVMVNLTLLGLLFGALTLALGCATGKQGLSAGISATLAVAAYFINSLAPVVEALEPYRQFSPFYHYIGRDPLVNGLDLGNVAVLLGLTGVCLVAALLAFERRDLAV